RLEEGFVWQVHRSSLPALRSPQPPRHLGGFAAFAGRQARRHGPRVARPLRRGAVGSSGSSKVISSAHLVHGAPRSDRGVNRPPPGYIPPTGPAASESAAGASSAVVQCPTPTPGRA